MVEHAPAPWDFEASGKPGSNGDLNIYVVDKNKRKIAAVWGKREEKELTASLMISAPDLLALAKSLDAFWSEDFPDGPENNKFLTESTIKIWRGMRSVIAQAEGRVPAC